MTLADRLSRLSTPSPTTRTLETLKPLALEPGYVAYVEDRFEKLLAQLRQPIDPKAQPKDQNAALSRDR